MSIFDDFRDFWGIFVILEISRGYFAYFRDFEILGGCDFRDFDGILVILEI